MSLMTGRLPPDTPAGKVKTETRTGPCRSTVWLYSRVSLSLSRQTLTLSLSHPRTDPLSRALSRSCSLSRPLLSLPADTPARKRLNTNDRSNILVYMTGHGGDQVR